MKEKILEDKNLETLGIIKEIDVLAIINKAGQLNKKKEMHKIQLILSIICIMIFVFSIVTIYISGIICFLLIEVIGALVIPICLISFIKKRYV